ncbi:MAG: NUDIX domain-containing protein [Phycisphaerales bacterium JB043]
MLAQHDRVLLCQNAHKRYHYLPGGHIEPGETAAQALAREFLEETGLVIAVGDFLLESEALFIQDSTPRHEYTKVFHVEHSGAQGCPPPAPLSDDVPSLEADIAFQMIPIETLSELDLRPASMARWLISYLADPDGAPAWISVDDR